MQTDEILTRSAMAGSSARRRLELKFGSRLSKEVLDEIQHQTELAYMQAVQEVFLSLAKMPPAQKLRVA